MMTTSMGDHSRKQQTEEMIPLLVRHEIQVLLRAGLSQRDVAARVGVSVRAVRRVLAEDAVTHVDDTAERRARNVGRPSKATLFTESVRTWLGESPSLPTQELLRRATEAGYRGHNHRRRAPRRARRVPQGRHDRQRADATGDRRGRQAR